MCRVIGQVCLVATIKGVHDIDFVGAMATGLESDALPIRRPGWHSIKGRIIGQLSLVGAVNVNQVDVIVAIALGCESNRLPIGRPGRSPGLHEIIGHCEWIRGIVDAHHPDLGATAAAGVEGNVLSIR